MEVFSGRSAVEYGEFDWAFLSFAIHLFSPEDEARIIARLLRIVGEGLMIIDHKRKWNLGTAIIEWIEGSYYDKYLAIDFKAIASENGIAKYAEFDREDCFVMLFRK